MEDFEYSVEICDRDWECFFAECEECNLLPPSLAGVDDSGMSDIDDTGSILGKRVQRVDPTVGFSEPDRAIDGPPDCEGSPVEHYLSKHGVGGMESVLSGSEEDIHLQSVNMFFERLKNVTEAERLTEPSQVKAGKNREEIQEEERCSDGQQASSSILPKNIPKLNFLPARGETAFGRGTTEPVDTFSNVNTMKKDKSGSNISPEAEASNSALNTDKSAHPETKLFIREEACTETRVNEATQRNQSHDSPDGVVWSEATSHTDKVIKVEMCTPLDDVSQEDVLTSQFSLSEKCSSDLSSNLERVTNVKWKEDQYPYVIQSDATSSNNSASHDSSPSASIRRKKRKKRRLSVEPAESVQEYEKQVLVKKSDSEEEQYACRRGTGLCVSEDFDLFKLNEPSKNATINLPVKISANEIKVNDLCHYSCLCDSQYQYLPESIVRQGRCKAAGSAENNAANDLSPTPLSQTDDSVMSAPNNSGNVAKNVQPCSKLQVQESTGLNKYPGLPVSNTNSVTGKSDLATWNQSDKMNYSIICCENEQNPESCTAEVKSIALGILPSAESNDSAVEVSQNDKLSAAKSVLAVEAGKSGRDNHTLCQREAEPQQQLESDQYSSTLEKTHFLPSATGMSSSDAHNTKPKHLKTIAYPFLEEVSNQVDCAKLTLDTSNSLSDIACLSKSSSSLDTNTTAQQIEHPLVLHTLSKCNDLTAERAELAASQIMAFHGGNQFMPGEMNVTGKNQRETKDLLTNPSGITPISSCCTLESVMSLSNENITDISGTSSLSVSQNDSGGQEEKTALILAKHEEGDGTSGPKSQSVSNDTKDSKCDLVIEAEDAITASKAECEPRKAPDSKNSVFAMSSFWSEMEKLTINDILGLRMISEAPLTSSLPPLQECEETNMFSMNDSGFFTQLHESKPEQTNEDTSSNHNSVESSSGCVTAVDCSSPKGVMWQSEPVPVSVGADIYPENMMLTSVSEISQPVLPGRPQTCLRRISKNASVHNLHALESESFSYTWKTQGQTLQTLDEGELEKGEYFPDGPMPRQDKDMDCLASSPTDSYRISFTDIFQYLFGGKQSIPSQPATDNITPYYTDGNSVPETYDHFFSEFDTESFFYPLLTEEDRVKDELVPIFSYSRSANRNLQYPEAYDYFFASSSSDDESDEEDNRGPVRVVTRFNRTSSTSQLFTDIYDNFFTDNDLKQNLFWRSTFSFRNISITGSPVQKQTPSNPMSCVPMRQSGKSQRRTIPPINALGHPDVMFSDPLLCHLEDRISRQLTQKPFRYQELQTAVSNPRLDASLLPLRQSDMCLVCIAFASWVLKTANPEVGDAWKAVLLANVSALSAIRYLRKYVKIDAAASDKIVQYTAPSDS